MISESLQEAQMEGNVQIDEVLKAVSKDGNTLGAVMQITSKEGYGGDICFMVGIQKDGTVNGISILSISETAGLGMKANTEEFKTQFFKGKKWILLSIQKQEQRLKMRLMQSAALL